ncbi:VWA domain-containing protein [Candidatus Woesearchaeota archaeon]|nr:VWA domain-containing protein [Candidatus Woesearchaeota archaeon]
MVGFDSLLPIYLIIPALIVLLWLIRHDFVTLKGESLKRIETMHRKRILVFCTRAILIICLLLALANPYTYQEKTLKGEPRIVLLYDNSTSMSIFDTTVMASFKESLGKKIPIEEKYIAFGKDSALGEHILNNIRPDESVLLMTDGNSHGGSAGIIDTLKLAAFTFNSTVHAIKFEPVKKDVSVSILGPAETVAQLDNTYAIKVHKVGYATAKVSILVDGTSVFDQDTAQDEISITRKFATGTHTIEAHVSPAGEDLFPENNAYYKTTNVIEKPPILFVTKDPSSLSGVFDKLYAVETTSAIPDKLDKYYAVVLNNLPQNDVANHMDQLISYLNDGNGMVVFGGLNAFEYGGYQGTLFENVLPLRVDTETRSLEADTSIIIAIDISGSSKEAKTKTGVLKSDINKAVAINIMKNMKPNDLVGVITFNSEAHLVSQLSDLGPKQKDVEQKILSLEVNGQTWIDKAIRAGTEMLQHGTGSKNIVIISDGITAPSLVDAAKKAADDATKQGIRVFTVGVGEDTNEDNMRVIADSGKGQYFKIDESKNIRLVFGKAEKRKGTNVRDTITVISTDHFITRNLQMEGIVTGFNFVTPKTSAKLLLSTSNGDPLLAAWRFGLGRVASFGADDGSYWAPELFNAKNIVIIPRTLNWAIGDPKRKYDFYIDATDGILDKPNKITVISQKDFTTPAMDFAKVDKNLYEASFVPKTLGFQSVMGKTIGVNYEEEYLTPGMNSQFLEQIPMSGGKTFTLDQTDAILQQAVTDASKTKIIKQGYYWIFLLIALVVFLIELTVRRIWEFQAD